jgi:hypothetical protein
MQRRYANRLIAAAEVVDNLGPIGPILPTTETQARPLAHLEPDQQREAWQQAVDTAPNGKVTAAHVQSVVDEYEQQANELAGDDHAYNWTLEGVIYPEKEERVYPLTAANHAVSADPDYDGDEWYTPTEFIEAARTVLGEIDLDPASCPEAQQRVRALEFMTKEFDSLRPEVNWFGRVWLNPPYSTPLIKYFVAKLIDQYESGHVTEAIIITNNSSDTGWFHDLLSRYPACFTRGRAQFWRADSTTFGARQGQTLFYLGDDFDAFRFEFSKVGQVVIRA